MRNLQGIRFLVGRKGGVGSLAIERGRLKKSWVRSRGGGGGTGV